MRYQSALHCPSSRLPHLLASILLILTCAGCGNPDRKKLVGTWKLDQSNKVEKRIADSAEFSVASKMLLEFRGNGLLKTTTKMGGIDGQKSGTWQFVSYEESTKTMQIKCNLGMEAIEQEIEFVSHDRIKLVPPNMAGLTLKLEFLRE